MIDLVRSAAEGEPVPVIARDCLIATTGRYFAGLRSAEGRVDDAARLWGAADGLLQSVAGALVPTIAWIRDRYLPVALAAMGEAAFENARREGRVMRAEQAITFVGLHRA